MSIRRKKIIFILSIALIQSIIIAAPFGDGFLTEDLSKYIKNASKVKPAKVKFERVKGMSGKNCLRLTDRVKVKFLKVPVDENTKYTLSFNARFDGSESIEENSLFYDFLKPNKRTQVVPTYTLEFFDSNAKRLRVAFYLAMPFRKWHQYKYTFYPPVNAVSMGLIFQSGKKEITCFIDKVKLEKTSNQGGINVNPVINTFAVGDYSGWSRMGKGAKRVVLDDGKTYFYSGYGSQGTSFPLSEPGTYCFSSKKKVTSHRYAVVLLRIYDKNGKRMKGFRIGRNSGKEYFILPKGTKRGYFNVYNSMVDDIHLNRVGDENKILELRKKK